MAITVSRKQRLRTLEKDIRSGMEEFYYTGMKLKEIRDDELFKEDGFETWEKYCRERWDYSKRYSNQLIVSAMYREKITVGGGASHSWSERSVHELTRIPDKKQAVRVAKKVVQEIERSEKEAAKNPEVKAVKLTSTIVRKFVDEDLGVDRAAKAKETKRQNEQASQPGLPDYLQSKLDVTEVVIERLVDVSADQWELLEEDEPGLAERLATACDKLAALLRS